MKKILIMVFLSGVCLYANAQKNDGTVSSLIATEEYFNQLAKSRGLSDAFIALSSDKGVVFRPNPTNTKQYYRENKQDSIDLKWKPEYAIISKDGNFGFTTGPYTLNETNNSQYGHYLSVWRSNQKKKWELVLDAGVTHPKLNETLPEKFIDPSSYKYPKLIGPLKVKMREDIVFNTDLLLSKALEKSGNKNFKEFYSEDIRYYFPDQLPIIGKQKALNFIDKMNKQVSSHPTFVDRAFSGDLAYTNGKATIGQKNYNYIRVWKIDPEMKWNIIIDMYIAE